MMKVLITGARGTVGSALRRHVEAAGGVAVAWDRRAVPTDDYHAMEAFVRATAPDALYHLAVASTPTGRADEGWHVTWEWTSELAWIARTLAIPFVFTSTVMVYTDKNPGPYTPATAPDAADGYGREKLLAEERVRHQNPDARIVRLGWQIGDAPGSNNMVDWLAREQAAKGRIAASRRWLPACSFVADTADALARLHAMPPGTYLLDANTRWSFAQIAAALNERHGGEWNVEADDAFVYDQRMRDERLAVQPLAARLPALGD